MGKIGTEKDPPQPLPEGRGFKVPSLEGRDLGIGEGRDLGIGEGRDLGIG
jgi:hypothetical protein